MIRFGYRRVRVTVEDRHIVPITLVVVSIFVRKDQISGSPGGLFDGYGELLIEKRSRYVQSRYR
jgi:hypothetical protein